MMRFLLRTIGFTLFAKIDHVEGVENVPAQGPAILMINHVAFLDPVILTGFFPRYLISMAKVEAIEDKLIGPIIKAFDAFPVNRGAGDRRPQALRQTRGAARRKRGRRPRRGCCGR